MNYLYHLFPSFKQKLHRTLTAPLSPVLFVPDQVLDQAEVPLGARPVSYLSFYARVGHNSRFIGLSDDDREELGGVEYRALSVLLWIVSGVSRFPSFFLLIKPSYLRNHACLVLHRHTIDIVCSAFPVHVDVEMEKRLPTPKPIPSY
jgi:hypothetical protein